MRRLLFCMVILCAAGTTRIAAGEIAAPVITLGQAQQAGAPALATSAGGLVAVWVGADERGVHQDARRVTPGGLSEVVTLPLPPTHPYDQQVYPGAGYTHLLWLDAGEANRTQLFAALLSPELAVERGPVVISDGLALDYSAVPDGAGGLWAAWSGGLLAEMTLFVRRIDDAGRPLVDTVTIAADAEHPALARTNAGEVWLFWLANGQLMRQRLDPPGDALALTGAVSLAPGDRLINVSAGLDQASAYFFWNITRASGANETWFTAGSLAARAWRQPQRLHIDIGAGAAFPLRWTVPLSEQGETLTALAESDAGLSLLQFYGGGVVGYNTLVPGTRLIGLPALVADATALYLAWSAPGENTADLQLLTFTK